ncbi:hypothetical protein X798_01384 [Onchocerca flexuosa]|uniref:F5/8 type C domain-containing protein n=2 Tax=Onchocerca flexuosa TaxID=387005 RepID=A0A183I1N1_9BILA|nr:hypothetical protein X798_01384 [Onchocerca flexuosa]VDP14277.1 unnamed protein product [Onchocerca flexuosa]
MIKLKLRGIYQWRARNDDELRVVWESHNHQSWHPLAGVASAFWLRAEVRGDGATIGTEIEGWPYLE